MSGDRLSHLAETFSQIEARAQRAERELAEAKREVEHWRRHAEFSEAQWFREAYGLAQEQRQRAVAIVKNYDGPTWPDELAEAIMNGPLVIEKDDVSRFDLQDVPPEGGGLT